MTRAASLPPDPDKYNKVRAKLADATLRGFCARAYIDEGDALADLLTDLRHWCDRSGYDFKAELKRAKRNYKSETAVE